MTQTLAGNASNDLYIGADGQLALATGLAAVQDACLTASKAQLGEMVLQVNGGLPNFDAVWSGTPNLGIYEDYLRRTLLAVDGVVAVTSLILTPVNGALTYTAQIESVYGPVYLNG